MKLNLPTSLAAVLSIFVVLLPAIGCGGSSSPSAPPGASFTPDGSAGANSISLSQNPASDANRLIIDVQANQVSGLFGINLELSYPTNVLRYATATEGGFLGNANVDTSFVVAERSPGELVIGLTRLRDVQGASGSGILCSLEFTLPGSGTGAFTLVETEAFGPEGISKPEVTWVGGSVQVTR